MQTDTEVVVIPNERIASRAQDQIVLTPVSPFPVGMGCYELLAEHPSSLF